MYTKILYMENVFRLEKEIKELMAQGMEINCVTHLRDFSYPNMDGVAVTDWLIVYKTAKG